MSSDNAMRAANDQTGGRQSPCRIDVLIESILCQAAVLDSIPGGTFLCPSIRLAHDRLIDLFNMTLTHEEVSSLLARPGTGELRARLCQLNASLHLRSEIEIAKSKIREAEADAFEGSWINPGFYPLLHGQVDRWHHLRLLNDGDQRPIMVVGNGALPQTQVFLHRCTGRTVIGIERDAESVRVAKDFLKRFGWGEQLPIVQADGCSFDYRGACMVVVTTLVAEKVAVAEQVFRTDTDAYLNIRTPTGLHRLWRVPIPIDELSRIGWLVADLWTPEGSSVSALTCIRPR
jgi:hypothetical protein